MRFTRKRFKAPERNLRAFKTLEDGREICLPSPAGRVEYKRRLGLAWRDQSGICPRCNEELKLVEAKFERQEFKKDEENRAVHKRCRAKT